MGVVGDQACRADPKRFLEELEVLRNQLVGGREESTAIGVSCRRNGSFILLPVNKALTAFTKKLRNIQLARAHPMSSTTYQ